MEERDQYQGDYSRKYYPKDDITSYAKYLHLMNAKPRYLAAVRKEDLEKMRILIIWNATINIATLLVSLLPVIFYKRLPWIRNFQSKFSRVLWSAAFVFIPSWLTSVYIDASLMDFIQRRYSLRVSSFSAYKQSGDILKINDEVRIVDS